MGGPVVEITPESAGWKYLGFRVIGLKAGEIIGSLPEAMRSRSCR